MQRVVDLKEEPIVGRRYLVPCVAIELRVLKGETHTWVPVFGGEHEDKDVIGFADMHWHFDLRFISDRIFRRTGGVPPIGSVDLKGVLVGNFDRRTVEKPRLCRRRMPPYPRYVSFREPLEKAYKKATVIEQDGCRLCPHRGLPLDGLPKRPDGSVVCRGHGLCWSREGKLVKLAHLL